ncbi:serine hydrolase [Antrihabitans cavernicola]|uniref:Serine hydrolase n=2 Tax=Antrihabitans cavernicola TaxID=2495913 RepID=A0A5A7SGR4_9NOCA|nr:serine hydrolase [Spelaeibacter cavernicola]KAA0024342.1 serine hydrolase [Spelaeibacter cavernicola]
MSVAAAVSIVALIGGCTASTSDDSSSGSSSAAAPSGSSAESSPQQSPGQVAGVALPENAVDNAIGKLDGLADSLMKESGIPGMAVAVVHGGKTVYAKGFGVRDIGKPDKVDADTVFQLASVSKSVGSTVIAHQVGTGAIDWDTPLVSKLPWFALDDPTVTPKVTIADMYAHRSGLPDHAGDKLEELGYDRRQVLERLRLVPLDPFRITYHYTNFGVTAGAEATAASAGTDWETLSQQAIYGPLGMSSTSSRFADFEAKPDHAVGHVKVGDKYVAQPAQSQRQPDAQSPAGGVSSSVDDMSHWLAMLLADGKYDGKEIVKPDALLPAVTAEIVSSPAGTPDSRSGYYGYGFNVSITSAGRAQYSHSGAFALGAGTNFVVLPSADVAIIALTNAAPTGVPETLTAEFSDLVQFGEVRQDWRTLYKNAFAAESNPTGSLIGKTPPPNAAAAQPNATYVGTYNSDYWGPAVVSEKDGKLVLGLGPKGQSYPLTHWDGDTFTFTLNSENAPPGSISKATFAGNALTVEYLDDDGLGRFTR